jgi:hypothetical protein
MLNAIIAKYGDRVRTHPLEVLVNNLSGKYFLPDDSILRNKTIVGLAVWTPFFDEENAAYLVQNSFDTDSVLIGADAFYNSYVSLMNNNVELISGHPLRQFGIYPPDREIQQIYVDVLTPSKSFITVSAPATVGRLAVNQVFQLNFVYLD